MATSSGSSEGQINDGEIKLVSMRPLEQTGESESTTSSTAQLITLKREVGLFGAVSMAFSTIVGTGIFIFASDVVRLTGSAYGALIVWCLGGLITLGRALCLAEAGGILPATGGWYTYIMAGCGRAFAFLVMWVSVLVTYPCTLAIMSISFARYSMLPFFGSCDPPNASLKMVATVALLLVSIVSILEVKIIARLQAFFMIAKAIPLIVIPTFGIILICLQKNNPENIEGDFDNGSQNPTDYILAFTAGLWAYAGWDCICFGRAELKKPEKNLPIALGISITSVMLLYLAVLFGYQIVLSPAQMKASNAVALDWAEAVGGLPAKYAMSVCVSIAIIGSMTGAIFNNSKLCYAAAREGQLVTFLSMIHVEKRTPIPPIILNAILAIIYLIPSDVSGLLDVFGIVSWLTIFLALLSVTIMKYHKDYKNLPRVFNVPAFATIFATVFALFMFLTPVLQNPTASTTFGLYIALFGVVLIYWPIFWMRIVPVEDFAPAIKWVTIRVQKLFQVVVPDH